MEVTGLRSPEIWYLFLFNFVKNRHIDFRPKPKHASFSSASSYMLHDGVMLGNWGHQLKQHIICGKRSELEKYLLFSANSKSHMAFYFGIMTFDPELPWKVKLTVTDFKTAINWRRLNIEFYYFYQQMKSHMGFHLAPWPLTLSDFQMSNALSCFFVYWH